MSIREYISRAVVDDTVFLDAFLDANAPASQFCNKACGIEDCLRCKCPSAATLTACEQLCAYGGGNAGHFRGRLLPPVAHPGMACAIRTRGLASRTRPFHLNIEEESP